MEGIVISLPTTMTIGVTNSVSDLSSDDVKRLVDRDNVRFINLQFTDVFGKSKNVAITPHQLDEALDNQIMFDGSSIKGFVRVEESDMYLAPDPTTFVILPWRSKKEGATARMICDVLKPNGEPFEGCPRQVLKSVLAELHGMGYEYYVGPEVEFFLFQTDEAGNPKLETHDEAGYFDLGPIDQGEDARRDMCLTLEDMGFLIEASHHEAAPGQHEIDFRYGTALDAADNVSTFKHVVKRIAKDHGLHATFMPKPVKGAHGTCMHLNQSLFRNGDNAFRDDGDENGLSELAYYFIGGMIRYAREFAAITNASVNSYKRLTSGFEAPADICWGAGDRSPLIRVPASKGNATRVELRNPDPTANHYLAFAAVLSAGIAGIKQEIKPPEAFDQSVYDLDPAAKKAQGIQPFPRNLGEALHELENSALMKEWLGAHIHTMYLNAKKNEWDEYNQEVHRWELKRYL